MAEYIEREKAIDACFDGWDNNAHDCAENIRSIPAADVRPVVRGKWVRTSYRSGYGYKCSVCGDIYHRSKNKLNYCPNCGAKMEES